MVETSSLTPRFTQSDPEVLNDPYPVYARLRAAGALCRGRPGEWVVPRYADVYALLRDPRLGVEFSEEHQRIGVGDGPAHEFRRRILLTLDPPAHTRLRNVLARAFSAAAVGALRARITTLVDDSMRQPLASGRFDAVEALAFPVAVTVLSELLGVPVEDRHEIRPRALALGTAFLAVVPNEDRPTANATVVWFRDYMERLIERRRREPGSDLISAMVTDPEAADIEVETLIDNAFFLCFSGFETTVNLISSGCALLAAHQDQLARLRANPSLVLSAVDEFLRFDAPIQSTGRIVRESLEIDGRLLRRGRLVTLLLGSANHDERQFADPGRLDITRSPNHHVSFGAGIHHCLGAALSRVEGVAVFSRLLQICDRFDANGSPLRTRTALFRGYAHVPVAVSPSRAMADGTVTAP